MLRIFIYFYPQIQTISVGRSKAVMASDAISELQSELHRLNQKYCILSRNYEILVEERCIAANETTVSNDSAFYETELKAKNSEIKTLKSSLYQFVNKVTLIRSDLKLQKSVLSEIRSSLSIDERDMLNDFKIGLARVIQMAHARDESQRFMIGIIKSQCKNLEVELESERSDFNNKFKAMELNIDELTALHRKNISVHEENYAALELSNSEVRVENAVLSDTLLASEQRVASTQAVNSAMVAERVSMEEKLHTLQSQFDALSLITEETEEHLRLSRLREEELMKEIQQGSSLQRQLWEIKNKVKDIESTHQLELTRLADNLEAMTRGCNAAISDASNQRRICSELEVRINELTSELLAKEEMHGRTSIEYYNVIEKKTAEIAISNRVATSAERSCEALREDRNTLQREVDALRLSNFAVEKLLTGAVSERDELQIKCSELKSELAKVSFERASNEKESALVESQKQQLRALTQSLGAKDVELAGLRDTVRRECEERVTMMLTISTLKDQVAKYKQQQQQSQPISSSSSLAALGPERPPSFGREVYKKGDIAGDPGPGGTSSGAERGRRESSRGAAKLYSDNTRGSSHHQVVKLLRQNVKSTAAVNATDSHNTEEVISDYLESTLSTRRGGYNMNDDPSVSTYMDTSKMKSAKIGVRPRHKVVGTVSVGSSRDAEMNHAKLQQCAPIGNAAASLAATSPSMSRDEEQQQDGEDDSDEEMWQTARRRRLRK